MAGACRVWGASVLTPPSPPPSPFRPAPPLPSPTEQHVLGGKTGDAALSALSLDDDDAFVVQELITDYCGVMRKLLSGKSVAVQTPTLAVAEAIAVAAGLPKAKEGKATKCLFEAIFMSLSEGAIIEKATFVAWLDANSGGGGNAASFKQVKPWLTWLSQQDSDESSSSDEE